MASNSRWSRPLVATLFILTLVILPTTQVNAINSDQQQQPTTTATTSKSETTTAAKTQQVRKVSAPVQSSGATVTAKTQASSNGRIVRNRPTATTTTTTTTRSPPVEATATSGEQNHEHSMMIHESIKRVMDEYGNTPPVFITPTRDFFLDIASYPLGYKLTTMQALDSDGDPIEYSLKRADPAQQRDAWAYFSINSTTGELRLANKRISLDSLPLVEKQNSEVDEEEEDDDDGDKQVDADSTTTVTRKPSYRYYLNVEANDGRYSSVVELQIHIFNSSTWGAATATRTPVQLTIEGGRQGGGAESLMRAKTLQFLSQLYSDQAQQSTESAASPPTQQHLNSSLVFPTFVNPGLTSATSAAAAAAAAAAAIEHNDLDTAASWAPLASSMTSGGVEQRHAQLAISSHAHQLDNIGHQENLQQVVHANAHRQPPVMLSLVIVICACLAVVLVTLVFLIPLSVKRLKKRLKNMEQLQHEQLSSSACSTSGSSSSTSSSARHHHHNAHHLPGSLSQFTLASSTTTPALLTPDGNVLFQRLPLGRQSSLDSAITQANFTYDSQDAYQAQLSMQTQINGLNRAKQLQFSSLLHQNPAYLTEPNGGANPALLLNSLPQQNTTTESNNNNNNIYCPIDDEPNYSTIAQTNETTPTNNRVIVGQTFDSRHYFGAQCAPTEVAQQMARGRDTDTPLSRSSSRSSTRSLARFLSLPARHWSRNNPAPPPPEVVDRKQGSFLEELEQQLGGATLQHAGRKSGASERQVKTIARVSRIRQEQKQSDNHEQDNWELERHKLKFLDILDEGQFGLVWRCKLRAGNSKAEAEAELTVAVKTLKSSAERDEREREELLAEIEIMKLVCGHPNVVRILHCCRRDLGPSKPILLVMEYVELGKLQGFLESSRSSHNYATVVGSSSCGAGMRSNRGSFEDEHLDDCGASSTYSHHKRDNQLSSRELIKFIYHVAKGMEYIASQSIVHRDLASRNVLISGQRVCKIGDFGMARQVSRSANDVYERHSRCAKIPVRWMAPEVLLENCFTSQSDVYSFGILMWEIVTLGSTPYSHLKTDQIIGAVAQRGERPQRPNYCHELLYAIMSRCWLHDRRLRPTFSELVGQLDELLTSSDEYIQLDQYPNHNYYNIPQTAAPLELL